ALVGVTFAILAKNAGAATLRFEIGNVFSLLIFDANKRRGESSDLGLLRHDQRHGLAAESDLSVVERPKRRAWRRNLVAVFFVRGGEFWPMFVCEDIEDARHCERISRMDAADAAPRKFRG